MAGIVADGKGLVKRLGRIFAAMSVLALFGCAGNGRSFDVRDYGARGDGKALDTAAINRTIEACAAGGGGRVVVGRGKYLTGTVQLRSNITLVLEEGAELVGSRELDHYDYFTPPENTPLVGGRLQWHRALVLADGAEHVVIVGRGVINGNNVTDAAGEEGIRGPHAVLLGNCKDIALRDISIRDAGNYAVFLEFSNHADVRGIKVTGGYDGVHVRGWKGRPCQNVTIADCAFYTGDDCIAGWYWRDTTIERCVLNSASNGMRLFGPAENLLVQQCRFFGPGRYPWRTLGLPNRKNMGAGLCVQPSAWGATEGIVDDVHIRDITMENVGTPLHIATISPSTIGHVTIDRLTASGVYRAAASIESWAPEPIGRVNLRDCRIQYVGGFGPVLSDPTEAALALLTRQGKDVKPPGVNPRPLPAWGLYARHVAELNLDHVTLEVQKKDERPAVILDDVRRVVGDPTISAPDKR